MTQYTPCTYGEMLDEIIEKLEIDLSKISLKNNLNNFS